MQTPKNLELRLILMADGGSCMVHSLIFGHNVPFLIDSGATLTVIRQDIIDQIPQLRGQIRHLDRPQIATLFDGTEVSFTKKVSFTMKIYGEQCYVSAFVTNNKRAKCVLGTDFLAANHVTLQFSTRKSLAKENFAPIHAPFNITIQPYSEARIPVSVKVSQQWPLARIYGHEFIDSCNLTVLPVTCEVRHNIVKGQVTIVNEGSTPKRIYKNSPIAWVRRVSYPSTLTLENCHERPPQQLQSATPIVNKLVHEPAPVTNTNTSQEHDLFYPTVSHEHLNEQQKQALNGLVQSYADIFYHKGDYLPEARVEPLRVTLLPTATHFHIPAYKRSRSDEAVVEREVGKLLEAGIIEKVSHSDFISPLLLVPKRDSLEKRVVLDLRQLNKRVQPTAVPLPSVDSCLEVISGQQPRFVSVLDLANGFYQLPVSPESRQYFAFKTRTALYQMTRTAMGFSGAPAHFSQVLATVLAPFVGKFLCLYLDDCAIFSNTFEEHVTHLQLVFDKLREYGLSLNGKKCQLAQKRVKFLSYMISDKGFEPDPDYISRVLACPVPTTKKSTQRFLGLVNYMRRFIPNTAKRAAPLYQILRKEQPFIWGEDQQKAFEDLKSCLTKEPVLAHFQSEKPVVIACDASEYSVGAILKQEGKVIAYFGKTIPEYLRRSAVYAKELHAIVSALSYWAHLIQYSDITVESDHMSLKYLTQQKRLSPKICRYVMFLQTFPNLKIQYKNAGSQGGPDALSRFLYPKDLQDIESTVDAKIFYPEFEIVNPPWENPQQAVVNTKVNGPTAEAIALALGTDESTQPNERIGTGSEGGSPVTEGGVSCISPAEYTPQFLLEIDKKAKLKPVNMKAKTKRYLEGLRERDISEFEPLTRAQINDYQRGDPECSVYLDFLNEGRLPEHDTVKAREIVHRADMFVVLEGTLYKLEKAKKLQKSAQKWYWGPQLVVPAKLQNTIIAAHHDKLGHFSTKRVYDSLSKFYWWPKMFNHIYQYCTTCPTCQIFKSDFRPNVAPLGTPVRRGILSRVTIDIAGPFERTQEGYIYTLIAVDNFTSYVFAYPLRSCRAETVASCLVRNLFYVHGICTEIVSDLGTPFHNALMFQIAKILGISLTFSASRHPQSHGVVERAIRTIFDSLKKTISQERRWALALPGIVFAHNVQMAEGSRFSPYYLMFARQPNSNFILMDAQYQNDMSLQEIVLNATAARRIAEQNIDRAQQRAKQYYDARHNAREPVYQPGDLVLLKVRLFSKDTPSRAMQAANVGPYIIIDMDERGNYRLAHATDSVELKNVYHANSLKPYFSPVQFTRDDAQHDDHAVLMEFGDLPLVDRQRFLGPNIPEPRFTPPVTDGVGARLPTSLSPPGFERMRENGVVLPGSPKETNSRVPAQSNTNVDSTQPNAISEALLTEVPEGEPPRHRYQLRSNTKLTNEVFTRLDALKIK